MDLHSSPSSSPLHVLSFTLALLILATGASGATFTFVNKCERTVWPGILSNAGSPSLESTGFELPKGSSRTLTAPTGWSGRFWGRTGCKFDRSGSGSCATGDCGSGQVGCNGAGAEPPATLAEVTLGSGGLDFYDVSLVDGYNLPLVMEATGGSGMCVTTGCATDLNRICPSELRTVGRTACRSACEAFSKPEYCCSGAYSTPSSCKPSVYSQMFKSACPRSYSYAYDDPTSTFTCSGADYTVTFCPSVPSQKSSKNATTATTTTTPVTRNTESGGPTPGSGITGPETEPAGPSLGMGMEFDGSGQTGSGSTTAGTGSESEAFLRDGSYLAGLAMGKSSPVLATKETLNYFAFASFIFSLVFLI